MPMLALSGKRVSVVPSCSMPPMIAAGDVEHGGRVAARHDREELVTAEPADRHAGRNLGCDATGDVAQHTVTRLVAERVVDFLEAVEVDEQHRRVVERASLQQMLHQRGPVGQAREGVDTGPVLELRFQCTLLGHVTQVQDQRAVVAPSQARVRVALLLELVGEMPLARDVVGERQGVVRARAMSSAASTPSTSRMCRPTHAGGETPTRGSMPGLM